MINLKKDDIERIIERRIDEKIDTLFSKTKPHMLPSHLESNDNLLNKPESNLKPLLDINFSDDFEKLLEIFNDEDTVIAVISTLQNCPEEIQVVSKIILDLHKKIDILGDEDENQI